MPDEATTASGAPATAPAHSGEGGLSFGEYYYAHDCGIPYERNEHWNAFFVEVARRLIVALQPTTVLDAGCAIGMLVEALRNQGVEAYGIDVSEWAIANMPVDVRQHCRQGSLADPIDGWYDLVTCIEVIEHIPSPDDERAIEQLCRVTNRLLISSSPHDYGEPTHVAVKPPEDWSAMFARYGFVRDLDFDATFLTPWAVLYRRNDDPLPEVVRRYERTLVRQQEEITQMRTHALQMHEQLEKDYSPTSIAELRMELLAVREEFEATIAEVGDTRGQVEELRDERDSFRGAADELAQFQRSKVWSGFELYGRLRRKVGAMLAGRGGALSAPAVPDLSLIVLGGGPFGAPDPDPACAIEVVDCAGESADARRAAMARTSGRHIAFVDAGDHMHRATARVLGPLLAEDRPGGTAHVLYTDEDAVDHADGRHRDPFLKPAWSPERLLSQEYLGRCTTVRRDIALAAAAPCTHDGAVFDHEYLLHATEHTDRVEHVRRVLYHRRTWSTPDPSLADARVEVVDAALRRRNGALRAGPGRDSSIVRLLPAVTEQPRVSVIVPTACTRRRVRGTPITLVENLVASILRHDGYPDLEIVLVVDSHAPIDARSRLHVLEERTASPRCKVVGYDEPFNFSAKINTGAAHASGRYFLLLNDDIEVTSPDWIDVLLAFASDPEIGAVAPRLLFADGRLQHVGVTFVDGHAGHPFYGYRADTPGYFGAPHVTANYSTVTAACLLTRRDCFEEMGGFSPSLPVNYNDVDYCLRLRRHGYRIVYSPDATLWHYESSSRGVQPPEQQETDLMQRRWRSVLFDDPYYSARFLGSGNYVVPATTDTRAVDEPRPDFRYWAKRFIRDLARVPSSRN